MTSQVEDADLETVVERRNQISKFLLALHSSRDNGGKLIGAEASPCFQLLLGVSFSLWRAAFLLRFQREEASVLSDATHFLHVLVRDNAITYPNDRDTCYWTVGYYLNNAYFRLMDMRERLPVTVSLLSPAEKNTLQALRHQGAAGECPAAQFREPKVLWDQAYEGASLFLRIWLGTQSSLGPNPALKRTGLRPAG